MLQQTQSLMLMLAICAASLLLASNSICHVESHSLGSLGELLASTGPHDSMNDQQLSLIGQISHLYEEEDNLHDEEAKLLNKVGKSRPDGKQKGALEVIFNKHLINMDKLEKLRNELSESVERKEGDQIQV